MRWEIPLAGAVGLPRGRRGGSTPDKDVAQMVFVHEAAAVHGAFDAGDAPVGRELPHDEFDVVCQFRFFFMIAGYHVFVVRVFPCQVFVVEVARGVDDGAYAVVRLYHVEKFCEPFAEAVYAAASAVFHVDDGDEVLFFEFHYSGEIVELGFRIHCWAEEVVAAHFQSSLPGFLKVVVVGHVHQRCAFRGFQVDVVHILIRFHGLPVYFSLIARHVDAIALFAGTDMVPVGFLHGIHYCVREAWGRHQVGLHHGQRDGFLFLLFVLFSGLGRAGHQHAQYKDGKSGEISHG